MDITSAIAAVKTIAERYEKHKDSIATEEATKTYLILPFIKDVLGYDYLDPAQVIPEFVADIPGKKGEKIDYAILDKDGKVIMLIECKCQGTTKDIGNHRDQLVRYFMCVQDVRIGVLTDGCDYEFYGDLDNDRQMDEKPFLTFSIFDTKESELKKLLKFTRGEFNIEEIIGIAEELKYSGEIRKYLLEIFDKGPDEDFVRFLAKKNYDKKLTAKALEKITAITKRALSQFINERVDERLLKAASFDREENAKQQQIEATSVESTNDEIVTTEEELLAYGIIKAIACELVPPQRIAIRDHKSYCAILFDDNNRLPVCRLYFGANKQICLFDKAEKTYVPITDIGEIYLHKDAILKTIKGYLTSKEKKEQARPGAED